MDSFEIDWKHYNSNGCTGLNIMSTSGADYPRPNQYVFAARFDSMTQLGKHFDKTMENSNYWNCLLYTSPSPRDNRTSRMPSSA